MADDIGVERDPFTTVISADRSERTSITTWKETYSSHQRGNVSFLFPNIAIVTLVYVFPST